MPDDLNEVKSKVDKQGESLTLLKWVFGIQISAVVAILLAAVPWAISIQTNLAVLASNVQKIDTSPPTWLIERLAKVEGKLEKIIENNLDKIPSYGSKNDK